jgi:4-hydroxyacetophenone monooxygenase
MDQHAAACQVALTDEQIDSVVQDANVPSLLASLAYGTGDTSLIPDELRPLPALEANAAAQGGLSAARLARGRALAARALREVRDGQSALPAEQQDPALLRRVMGYLTGEFSEDYLPLLAFELGITGAPGDAVQPGSGQRSFRVAVVGAGMSGLAASFNLQRAGIDHVVYDRHSDVGGVWLENTYPGCRLDTNNFTYSFSFAQKHDWAYEFSTQPEVQQYFADVATRADLRKHIELESEVLRAEWIEADARWRVSVRRADGTVTQDTFDALISAVGQLNQPSYPDLPGRDTFAGQSWHTARWNHDVDLAGQRVAVIGTGASAYQVVPAIAGSVSELVVFQRSAPYMLQTPAYHDELRPGQRWLFAHVPHYHRWYRFFVFWTAVEGRVAFSVVDPRWRHEISVSKANEELRQELVAQMQARYVTDRAVRDLIVPRYPPYGKRMLRDNGVWARALELDHVTLETSQIAEITPHSIRTQQGTEYEVDVIIYATGFMARDLLGTIDVVGRAGVPLREQWKDNPQAYLGITVPHFPNLFLLYGPNTNLVVNGSQVLMVESSLHYVLGCFALLRGTDSRALDCRPEALDEFLTEVDAGNRSRTWGAPNVTNWYKNSSGRVTQNWPFSILEYWQRTRSPVAAHYLLTP